MTGIHNKSERRNHRGVSLAALAFVLSMTWACEQERTRVQATETSTVELERSGDAALRHESEAVAFRNSDEHLACADSYARSARAAVDASKSQRWYQASRCAARAGDFRQSIFHLQAAASGGFDALDQVLAEPLFRPLHSGSRWLLVVDLITENQKLSPRQPQPTRAPSEQGPSTPCALIESIKDQLSLRS